MTERDFEEHELEKKFLLDIDKHIPDSKNTKRPEVCPHPMDCTLLRCSLDPSLKQDQILTFTTGTFLQLFLVFWLVNDLLVDFFHSYLIQVAFMWHHLTTFTWPSSCVTGEYFFVSITQPLSADDFKEPLFEM